MYFIALVEVLGFVKNLTSPLGQILGKVSYN